MLRDLHDQVIAEESSGQHSFWRDVYRKMRCPGPPCHHEGQCCWLDPAGKKHYKLRTHHMKALVKYVEQGGTLELMTMFPIRLGTNYMRKNGSKLENDRKSDMPHLL